jgi:hypothetical protein
VLIWLLVIFTNESFFRSGRHAVNAHAAGGGHKVGSITATQRIVRDTPAFSV